MLKHKSTANYKTWGKKEYVKLAKDNPIKFLKQSASDFFEDKEGYEIALAKELESFTQLDSFKKHFKDIVALRVLTYYKDRFEAKGK